MTWISFFAKICSCVTFIQKVSCFKNWIIKWIYILRWYNENENIADRGLKMFQRLNINIERTSVSFYFLVSLMSSAPFLVLSNILFKQNKKNFEKLNFPLLEHFDLAHIFTNYPSIDFIFHHLNSCWIYQETNWMVSMKQ